MKVYVAVTVHFTMEGKVIPMSFIWEDGKIYHIGKIKEISRLDGSKPGESRIMYTCIVNGKDTHLYYENGSRGRWFLERRSA